MHAPDVHFVRARVQLGRFGFGLAVVAGAACAGVGAARTDGRRLGWVRGASHI